jgi:hypothetical protein
MAIRAEQPADGGPLSAVTCAVFRNHPCSRRTEQRSGRARRGAGALTRSLVVTLGVTVVGHTWRSLQPRRMAEIRVRTGWARCRRGQGTSAEVAAAR